MQRLELLAPSEAEMVIAPAPGHRKIELVPPAALEGPTVVLHGMFQQIEGVRGGNELLMMHKGHKRAPGRETTKRSSCDQPDTRFCGRTRVRRTNSWGSSPRDSNSSQSAAFSTEEFASRASSAARRA